MTSENRRVFSDHDLEALSDILQRKLDENRAHHTCVFSANSASALQEFARQIDDPEVRQGIITMAKAWNDTGAWGRKMLFRGFLIISMLGLLYLGWLKFPVKAPH